MSSEISTTLPKTYSDQLIYLNERTEYQGCCSQCTCVAWDNFGGPKTKALHTEQQQKYRKEGDTTNVCLEGCIIRMKSAAFSLYCPIAALETAGNASCIFLLPTCGLICSPIALCCYDTPIRTVPWTFCKMAPLQVPYTCLLASNLGLTLLRCPANVLAPEVMSSVCHQEACDVCLQESTFYFRDKINALENEGNALFENG